MTALKVLALIVAVLVVIVLFFGLVNLMRGGPANMSQKLMRARIILQLIAVILVMAAFYFASHSGSPAAP